MKHAPVAAPTPASKKWARAAIVLGLLGLSFVAFATYQDRPLPDFKSLGQPVSKELSSVPQPIFVRPRTDQGNDILAVFMGEVEGPEVEVSVVFGDEDHPWLIVDELYDFFRWNFAWRREADIESFRFQYDQNSGWAKPKQLLFSTTYAAAQSFHEVLVSHESAQISYAEFELRSERPLIYINTWNHLFSNKGLGDAQDIETISEYPVYQGTRADVESIFRGARAGK